LTPTLLNPSVRVGGSCNVIVQGQSPGAGAPIDMCNIPATSPAAVGHAAHHAAESGPRLSHYDDTGMVKARAWSRYQDLERRALHGGERMVLDGATGSELTELPGIDWEGQWSGWPAHLTAPAAVETVHRSYVDSGADVVTTNTYCTNRHVMGTMCEQCSGRDIVLEANAVAVEVAQSASSSARERRVLVAGSMSNHAPSYVKVAAANAEEESSSCNPTATGGWPSEDVELRNYREQAAHLANSGVDLLLLEMVKDREHGDLIVEAASEVGIPVVIGFTLRLAEGGRQLTARDDDGLRVDEMIARWKGLPNVVGFAAMHCPAAEAEAMVTAIRQRWSGFLACYANRQRHSRGLVTSDSEAVYDDITPLEYAELANRWYAAGANLVGGCCGVGPAHIQAVSSVAKSTSTPVQDLPEKDGSRLHPRQQYYARTQPPYTVTFP